MLKISDDDVRINHRPLLSGSIVVLAAAAWLTLWMGGSTHQSVHAHHGDGGMHAAGPPPLTAALVFVASWTVMTIAMMLPTTLPLLTTFVAVARRRTDRGLLLLLVVSGYLVVWTLFGAIVHVGRAGVQAIFAHGGFGSAVWLNGGVVLILAGAYQFTALKRRCLEKCRSPLSFVIEHWRGRNERRQAFRLGVDHGIFCVGCCWALMLLMFVVGTANVAGMLILAVLMALEKNTRFGRRLGPAVGVVLLAWGTAALVWF